jgi:hypothetical protein
VSDAPRPSEPEIPETRPRGTRRRALSRWTRRLLALFVALIATLFLTLFTLDLGNIQIRGQSLKSLAEKHGSNYLESQLTIGKIRALLRPGDFEITDLRIQGKPPGTRPFFTAKRIVVHVPWWTILQRNQIFVEVQLYDWEMLVESWAGGKHNIPKLTPKTERKPGPKRYTTTVNFVFAYNGQFTYQDHATPWSVVGRNLNFQLVRDLAFQRYSGKAQFTNGTVQIQQYRPMRADMTTRFFLDGPFVRLQHIDLQTDGADTHVNGYVDFRNWPDQRYNVNSTIDFATMREIFFPNEAWRLGGDGEFTGIFSLYKNAPISRELRGQFRSHEMRVDIGKTSWTFPELHGELEWLPSRFAVTHADSEFLGGEMQLAYALEPLGRPGGATAKFNATYDNVDLHAFTDVFQWASLQPDGRMRGGVEMTWPNGRFSSGLQGTGETTIDPPAGMTTAMATLPSGPLPPRQARPPGVEFDEDRPYGRFPFSGRMTYRFGGGVMDFADSWAATPDTFISFSGRAFGEPTHLPFRVTSHDWQGSDRLFTAIMGQFTNPVGAIEVGGRGTFDGVLTESFRSPRIEGKFTSQAMYAWNVTWGDASGDLVIEDGFLDIRNGVVAGAAPGSVIRTDGRYSLGYKPGVEEMNARVRLERWPLEDLQRAFELLDWPVTGTLGMIDLQLHGPYRELLGSGQMRIDDGTAWKEPFQSATGDLVFEGDGLRINRIQMTKATGRILANAWIGWKQETIPARYSFTATGERIPVESLQNFRLEVAPLTGTLQFKANGSGPFDSPSYQFDGTIADLYAGDEGIGQVRAQLTVRDEVLTIDRLDAASPRLTLFGSGSVAMNDASDAQLFFRFLDTSLDPYVKFVAPGVSPYARAIATGSVNVSGPLAKPTDLVITATVEDVSLALLEYALKNEGPVTLVYEENAIKIPGIDLVGNDTKLRLFGAVDIENDRAKVEAEGQASLAILQLFYPELLAAGGARLHATLEGPLDASKLALTGSAEITDGRLKPAAFPQGLSNINGPITVDAKAIRIDGLRGVIGGGTIEFGGAIALRGYRPETFNLTAEGQAIQLRYPEDIRSRVRLDLSLTGPVTAPTLSGEVDVLEARYAPRVEAQTGLLGLAAGGAGAAAPTAPPLAAEPAVPVRLDVAVNARPTAFIDSDRAQIIGSARFAVGGTISRPEITGGVDIRSGRFTFQGHRYTIPRGTISFDNPATLEPFFDVEAFTQLRAPGQTFNVTLRINGTLAKFEPTITSEPWLPEFQILTLLLGETPDFETAELRARSSSQELQRQAMQSMMVTLLASPLSSRIGSVFERFGAVDTVDIVPLLGSDASLQQLNPTARIVLGKQISDRVFVTYSRTFSASQYEVILIEYDQNERVSWVLSRNEDRSFSLDFRLRYVF